MKQPERTDHGLGLDTLLPSTQASQGFVRFLTCGSVDDGKSTLIGRLLWDAGNLYDDQRSDLESSRLVASSGSFVDFSRLVDGLSSEREQGITIDIAWRYFDAHGTRFVVIDCPGHEQYTRNMVSGASHADAAVILLDVRHGIKSQTCRHVAILDLMGIKKVILAINKIDLIGYCEEQYLQISSDFLHLTKKFNFTDIALVPISALLGHNVASRSDEVMSWYQGPALLECLENLALRREDSCSIFRMPVQIVLRDGLDFRGLAGTISSGSIAVGDRIIDSLGGKKARISRIAMMEEGDLEVAFKGQAIVVELDEDIDISRGSILSHPRDIPIVTRELGAKIVWLSEKPFDKRAGYLFRTATDLVSIDRLTVEGYLDLETMVSSPSEGCSMNDISVVSLELARPVVLDRFCDIPGTGCFIIIDELSGDSVAAGVVVSVNQTPISDVADQFILDRQMLAQGLCKGLGEDEEGQAEFLRRAKEAVVLLRRAGVCVRLSL